MQLKIVTLGNLVFTMLSLPAIVNAVSDSAYGGRSAGIIQAGGNGTISGTIKVIDGCSFEVDNFFYTSVANETVWYGRLNGNYSVGARISDAVISTANNVTVVYELLPSVRWDDLDTLIMYSTGDRMQVAYARFDFAETKKSITTIATAVTTTAMTTMSPMTTMAPSRTSDAAISSISTAASTSASPTESAIPVSSSDAKRGTSVTTIGFAFVALVLLALV